MRKDVPLFLFLVCITALIYIFVAETIEEDDDGETGQPETLISNFSLNAEESEYYE